jgi:two-component system C4-dicarboxylate transport sensor histidine kinase DctB
LVSLLVALAGTLLCGAVIYLRQRRQFVLAKLDENDRLERRVAERTAALNREIEERKRAEDDLRQAQATLIQTAKLAALGRMSAAIVHEVSQPLSALENTLASSTLLAERGDIAAVGPRMKSARDLVERIRRTVKHLRSFARNEKAATDAVSVAASIGAAVELARHRADGDGVEISMEVPQPLAVSANAVRLEQVILNLLVNAMDAVAGRLQPKIAIVAMPVGDMVEIRVSDNGAGIANENRDRIAEPFFTTKQTGEGLGLGLSISRAIVAEFGGTLTFKSVEGTGSTFIVRLPAADSRREAAE